MPSTPQRNAAANARSGLRTNNPGGTTASSRRGAADGAATQPAATQQQERAASQAVGRERGARGRGGRTSSSSQSQASVTNTNNSQPSSGNNNNRNDSQPSTPQQTQGGTSRSAGTEQRGITTPARQRTSSGTTATNGWPTTSPNTSFGSPTRASTRLHNTAVTTPGGGSYNGGNGTAGPSPTASMTTPGSAAGDRGITTSSSRRLRNPPGNPSPRASLRRGGTAGTSGNLSNLTLSQGSFMDLSPGSIGSAGGGGVGGGTGGVGGGPRTPGLGGNHHYANRLGHPMSQQSMRVIPSPIANSPAGWNQTQFVPTTPGRGGGGGGGGLLGTGSRTVQQYLQHHLTPGMSAVGVSGGVGGDYSVNSNESADTINGVFAPVTIDRDQLSIENMRSWRIDATHQHLYKTAAYWGDKLLSITDDPNDVFWLSQIYFDTGEYARAIKLLQRQELIHTSIACRFLATQCYIKMEKWSEALELLGEDNEFSVQADHDEGVIKLEASLCHLRGIVFKNLNNIQRAKECFIEALHIDIKCYEALDALISNSMLTMTEERELVESLEFNKQLIGQDATFVKMLYQSKLKKYDQVEALNEIYQALEAKFKTENADLIYSRAEIHFTQSRFEECLSCTKRILKRDKFNLDCVPMHLVCLYELDLKNDLFLLVHDLVDQHPNHAVAWFGVGVYYYLIGNMAEARRYFSKSSTIDPHYGPAWIGFGHSFAAEGEHDQAIAAYATSSKLLQGSHLGPMYIGMQHLQQNNTLLAQKYLSSCLVLCDKDPLLLNELGVMHYNLAEYDRAIEYFEKLVQTLELSQRKNVIWETTWLNLGHAHRKLGHYQDAETYYLKVDAVSMGDTKASALVALGFVYQIMGQLNDAVDAYHKVLALRPSDQVASDMLKRVMEDKVRETEQEWFVTALPQELQTDEAVHHLLEVREKSRHIKERMLKRLHGRPSVDDDATDVPLRKRQQQQQQQQQQKEYQSREHDGEHGGDDAMEGVVEEEDQEDREMRMAKHPRTDSAMAAEGNTTSTLPADDASD